MINKIIKDIVPPIFIKACRRLRNGQSNGSLNPNVSTIAWNGDYPSWQSAMDQCTGYAFEEIIEKCREAVLQVKHGLAVYERDSVLFDKIQYSWGLLSGLQNIALNSSGYLSVVDFGGSLGSTYFQNKNFLGALQNLTWTVIEQEHFVAIGNKEIADAKLSFRNSIEEAIDNRPNCLILSGVLQYLKDPYSWIERTLDFSFPYIIIDRTSFIQSGEERLTVQTVPDSIYNATYPCWFFNESKLLSLFGKDYIIEGEFDSYADESIITSDGARLFWKGFILKRK